MSCLGPIQRQRDYFKANTAPRGWARWLPVLRAPSPCKYTEAGGPENSFWPDKTPLSLFWLLNQRHMLTHCLPFGRNGSTVPLGPASDTGILNPEGYTLNYNEFIIYNPNQVRMRYLLKVQFNFLQLWWLLMLGYDKPEKIWPSSKKEAMLYFWFFSYFL